MEASLIALAKHAPPAIQAQFQRRRYACGTKILPSKEPMEFLFIIASGITEVMKESYSGAYITVNTFEAGSFLGEIELFCPELTPYKVMAKTDCDLLLVPKDAVFAWMQAEFAVTRVICETFSRRLYFTSDTMSRIAMLPLKERILGCIDARYRVGTLATLTKQMLVSQTRAPLRSVNRIVRECTSEGIIAYRNKVFTVVDSEALAAYALEYEI